GLTYKRDISDLRESPALEIREALSEEGAIVKSFDPYAPRESGADSIDDALAGADAAVVATDHSVFTALLPEVFLKAGVKVLVDGRNCLPKDLFLAQGMTYLGIGR